MVANSNIALSNATYVQSNTSLGKLPRRYYSTNRTSLFHGDAHHILYGLERASVDCIITSPPYYGQRDYGAMGQIGLEADPVIYIDKLIKVFAEAKRVLKPGGSLWVNIGDTYWSGKGKSHGEDAKQKNRRFERPQDKTGVRAWCVPKQLLLIPHRFAIAMQESGWIVRNDNVWNKLTPMPDPAQDRSSVTHEYVFHFVLQQKYYYDIDAVGVPSKGQRRTKSPSSVWSLKRETTKKEHIATFPENLVSLPIRATCPPNGHLLDPFCGSGTSLVAALNLKSGSRVTGIDISLPALREAKAALINWQTQIQSEISPTPGFRKS